MTDRAEKHIAEFNKHWPPGSIMSFVGGLECDPVEVVTRGPACIVNGSAVVLAEEIGVKWRVFDLGELVPISQASPQRAGQWAAPQTDAPVPRTDSEWIDMAEPKSESPSIWTVEFSIGDWVGLFNGKKYNYVWRADFYNKFAPAIGVSSPAQED